MLQYRQKIELHFKIIKSEVRDIIKLVSDEIFCRKLENFLCQGHKKNVFFLEVGETTPVPLSVLRIRVVYEVSYGITERISYGGVSTNTE